ncbi:MAG: DUF3987 domain-containing protein, partial [Polynucleobacter sp.]|nr:DUF3987 domain-containing protein [Polynucleobacter sp.]
LNLQTFTGGTWEGAAKSLTTPESDGHLVILHDELECFLHEMKIVNQSGQGVSLANMGYLGSLARAGSFYSKTLASTGKRQADETSVSVLLFGQPDVEDLRMRPGTATGDASARIGFFDRFLVFAAESRRLPLELWMQSDDAKDINIWAGCIAKGQYMMCETGKRLVLDEPGNQLVSQVYRETIEMHNRKKRGDRLPTLRTKLESTILRLAAVLHIFDSVLQRKTAQTFCNTVPASVVKMAVCWFDYFLKVHPVLRSSASPVVGVADGAVMENLSQQKRTVSEDEAISKIRETLRNTFADEQELRMTFGVIAKKRNDLRLEDREDKINAHWIALHADEICEGADFLVSEDRKAFIREDVQHTGKRRRVDPNQAQSTGSASASAQISCTASRPFRVPNSDGMTESQLIAYVDEISVASPAEEGPQLTM